MYVGAIACQYHISVVFWGHGVQYSDKQRPITNE